MTETIPAPFQLPRQTIDRITNRALTLLERGYDSATETFAPGDEKEAADWMESLFRTAAVVQLLPWKNRP